MTSSRPGVAVDGSPIRQAARAVVRAEVTDMAIDPAMHAAEVDRTVDRIACVAHLSAGEVLAGIAADVVARTEVEALSVSHRIGELGIGECALVGAVSAAHRGGAFAAAALLVDKVKRLLPVGKRQIFTDGTDEWVGCA